jgi:hypothetical protein
MRALGRASLRMAAHCATCPTMSSLLALSGSPKSCSLTSSVCVVHRSSLFVVLHILVVDLGNKRNEDSKHCTKDQCRFVDLSRVTLLQTGVRSDVTRFVRLSLLTLIIKVTKLIEYFLTTSLTNRYP